MSLQRLLPCLLFAVVFVGLASPASAMYIQVTQYAYSDNNGSLVNIYVSLQDESDGANVHHDYEGSISVTGEDGTYTGGGSGLGPFMVSVPLLYQEDDDSEDNWSIDAYLAFVCDALGLAGGWAPTTDFMSSFSFKHHYVFLSAFATAYHYSRHSDSNGRKCAPDKLTGDPAGMGHMTSNGTGFTIYGNNYICARVCTVGWSTPPGVSGPFGSEPSGSLGTC